MTREEIIASRQSERRAGRKNERIASVTARVLSNRISARQSQRRFDRFAVRRGLTGVTANPTSPNSYTEYVDSNGRRANIQGFTEATADRVATNSGKSDIMQYLPYIGIGVVALYMFKRKGK